MNVRRTVSFYPLTQQQVACSRLYERREGEGEGNVPLALSFASLAETGTGERAGDKSCNTEVVGSPPSPIPTSLNFCFALSNVTLYQQRGRRGEAKDTLAI